MTLNHIGFIIHTAGEVMVAFTAIMVHHRVWKEHKIDQKVFFEMKRERTVGILGLMLIIGGFLMEILHAYLIGSFSL